MKDSSTENTLANDLVRDLIKEKRSERRWKNIRFFLGFLFIVFLVLVFTGGSEPTISLFDDNSKDYVSLVRLGGTIDAGQDFSAVNVIPILKKAISDPHAKGLIIDINSGGGSPVQSSIIHDAIVQLKNKYHKKVIVIGEDLLASGAYLVAASADKIYVNPNTITGSIGVIMKGFGFPELLKKTGIERRVYTAGENKDRLDMFLPPNKDDEEKIKSVINEVHTNFKAVVMEGRKNKLRAKPEELFTGDFWSGQTAMNLGLVDGLGNLPDVMHKEFNVSRYKDYSGSQNVLHSLLDQVGASVKMALGEDSVQLSSKI